MAKDRAAPFSRKHRRYWLPVTGGMIAIAAINLALGLCSYHAAPPPEHMALVLDAPRAPGTISASQLPAAVMRAFNLKYPRTIPSGARPDGDTYVVMFPAGAPHASATFRADGTFVSEQ
ncbi:MAG TPA: hypothetical protein VMJ10_25945 [Kofleriaceae bacterium]|nr:hypothetical protein [Kofleriaceae bacterium]